MFFWPCDIQFFFSVFIYWTEGQMWVPSVWPCVSPQVGTKYKSSLPVQLGGDLLTMCSCRWHRWLMGWWVPGSIPLVSKRLFRRRPERPLLRWFQAVGSSGRSNGGQSRCAQGDGGDGNWVMFDQQWLGLSFAKQTSEVGIDLIFQFLESITQSTNMAIFAGYPTKKGSIH